MSRAATARASSSTATSHSHTSKKPTLTVIEGGKKGYPITEVEDPVRPFRIWDTDKSEYIRWRYFSDPKRAHIGALIEARWAKVGTVLEVIDARTAKLLGQYKRHEHTITFMR